MTTVDQDKEVAHAMETARQVFEALSADFCTWAGAQPPASVPLAGAATGVAKLAGGLLHQIDDRDARAAAVVGALVTLLANADCEMDLIVDRVKQAIQAYALATVEEAGHA